MLDAANCTGNISKIHTNTGSIISSRSEGNIDLLFDEFSINGSSDQGSFAGIGLYLIGLGNIRLTGNYVNTGNADIGVLVAKGCRLSLRINNMDCNQNRILFDVSAEIGGMYLDFMQISVGNSTEPSNFIFNLTNGSVTMRGGDININANDKTTIPLFNIVENSNLTCSVQNIQCPAGLLTGSTIGSASISFNALNCGNPNMVSTSIINVKQGVYQLNGRRVNVVANPIDDLPGSFINFNGDAQMNAKIDDIFSPLTVAFLASSKNFWYKTESSVVFTKNPVVIVSSPIDRVIYTLSGLFQTFGEDAITILPISADCVIRLISSTLISNSVSINNFGNTKTVVIVPSIANKKPNNIVEVPPGTLLIDSGVV